MNRIVLRVGLIVLVGSAAGRAWAQTEAAPAEPTPSGPGPERVVVSATGEATRFAAELERELRASSFTAVEVPHVAFEPQAMLAALREAQASRGVLLSDEGLSVVVFSLTRSGRSLRVYGEYALDPDDRLARRRQWISLVERLRVPPEDDAPEQESQARLRPATSPAAFTASPAAFTALAPPLTPAVDEPRTGGRPARLGASAVLGYARGNHEILSHLLLIGQKAIGARLSLFGAGLWPLAGERVRRTVRSRAWTFALGGGGLLDLGRPTWAVQPFVGLSVGAQVLVVYVDYQAGGQSDVEKALSALGELHLGTRIRLRSDMAFSIQFSGARTIGPASATRTLADTWLARTSVGLLIDF